MTFVAWVFLISVVAWAGVTVFYTRAAMRTMVKRVDQMLDEAIAAQMPSSHFDEAACSALETKLAQFLNTVMYQKEQLEQERLMIQRLVSDISHQTKTPMSNILLYTELLAESSVTATQADYCQILTKQVHKLQSFMEVLVKSSRLEVGMLKLHPERLSVQQLLTDASAKYRHRAEAKHQHWQVENGTVLAEFDMKWTLEPLGNLLDNAIKYTPDGGTITLSSHETEAYCAVCVRDTGVGIPETEQAKIFGRFYRGTHQSATEGIGIGLYLARQIVELQGGYLMLRSHPGAGSEFCLYLPKPTL